MEGVLILYVDTKFPPIHRSNIAPNHVGATSRLFTMQRTRCGPLPSSLHSTQACTRTCRSGMCATRRRWTTWVSSKSLMATSNISTRRKTSKRWRRLSVLASQITFLSLPYRHLGALHKAMGRSHLGLLTTDPIAKRLAFALKQ